jgi:prepilin-type N-terminal cleavage/methylation domain-containing protein
MLNRRRIAAEDGFTIIELLVAMVVGLFVLAAAMVLVSQATQLTASAQDRVDATQRARRGVEDMVVALRAGTCVPLITTASPLTTATKVPLVAGDSTSVTMYVHLGTENALPEKRVLTYDATTRRITESRYAAASGSTATAVSFATTATTSRVLLDNVVPVTTSSGTTPIFSYSKYTVDNTVTPPKVTGLTTLPSTAAVSAADLPLIVQVNISVRVRPFKATADSKKDTILQTAATARLADPLNALTGIPCT